MGDALLKRIMALMRVSNAAFWVKDSFLLAWSDSASHHLLFFFDAFRANYD